MTGMESFTSRRLGILLVLASAIGWSLAGVFTKGVGADAWSVIFWRGVFAAPLVMAWLVARNGWRELTSIFHLGTIGWIAATVSSLATAAFLMSFKHTYIANVALIYAAVPFAAAAIAMVFAGVPTSHRTDAERRCVGGRRYHDRWWRRPGEFLW